MEPNRLTPAYQRNGATVYCGDCREVLSTLPASSVHCCVTSPPYWGLRDYGVDNQLGLEKTPEEYVANLVEVFRDVRQVLRKDATLWLVIGDSYASGVETGRNDGGRPEKGRGWAEYDIKRMKVRRNCRLKPKDLVGIPWRLAFALQADGWYLRSEIIWVKPNPMPESVTDRPTKAHEQIFLLSKSGRYYYDAEAVKERSINAGKIVRLSEKSLSKGQAAGRRVRPSGNALADSVVVNPIRNRRSVWTVGTQPYKEAHFAVYPPKLIEPCILAGTSDHGCCPKCGTPWMRVVERGESDYARLGKHNGIDFGRNDSKPAAGEQTRTANGTVPSLKAAQSRTTGWRPACTCGGDPVPCLVLDPFAGTSTTGVVALRNGRHYLGIELSPDYLRMSVKRLNRVLQQPLLKGL